MSIANQHRSLIPALTHFPIKQAYLVLCIFLILITGQQSATADSLGKPHKDKKLGFSIRTPSDWNFVVSPDSERYIVGKFISDRILKKKKMKDFREYASHRPEMWIIAFTSDNTKIKEEKREVDEISYISSKNPYKDYKELTKRTTDGFYFGDEKESTVNKVPCTFIEVIMEQNRPPLRRVSCVYHLDDVDVAVYFEIMEEHYPKYKSLFTSALKSFKTIEREIEAPTPVSGSKGPLTREEFIDSKTKDLPKDWWYRVSKSHLIISHTDKKYTEKVSNFADSIRKVIDKEFKKILPKNKKSKKDDVSLPIIRICSSPAEFNAFNDTTEGFSYFNAETREVVVYNGTKEGYDIEWVYSRIGSGIYSQYQSELFMSDYMIPEMWYTLGMSYYYSSFKGKGSSLKYVDDDWQKQHLKRALKSGQTTSLKVLLNPDSKSSISYENYLKWGFFVCFLKSKEGRRKPWKGVLDRYMENFLVAHEDMRRKQEDEVDEVVGTEVPDDEDEADEVVKKISKDLSDLYENMRTQTYQKTFGDWKDSDWDHLEKALAEWL